ncbi:Uncharacterised protein [Vibrio cholerae]|nr:Uncharacterised protein [Vibrio cholerae]CSB47359.1 Uncharacterised protein [Vibrio cholerae]CSI58280.1 Uncharacterised protein [Vibrio cholerae]
MVRLHDASFHTWPNAVAPVPSCPDLASDEKQKDAVCCRVHYGLKPHPPADHGNKKHRFQEQQELAQRHDVLLHRTYRWLEIALQ